MSERRKTKPRLYAAVRRNDGKMPEFSQPFKYPWSEGNRKTRQAKIRARTQ